MKPVFSAQTRPSRPLPGGLLVWLLAAGSSVQAQDVITRRDSSLISGYVVEATPARVRYRLPTDSAGIVRQLPADSVLQIRLADGATQLIPPPDGRWLPELARPAVPAAVLARPVRLRPPRVAALPGRVPSASAAPRPAGTTPTTRLRFWRTELGAASALRGLPNSVFAGAWSARLVAEWPVYAALAGHRQLVLGLTLQARLPRPAGASPDSLRPAPLLQQPHLLPFLSLSGRQRLGGRVYLVARLGLSPGRLQRVPLYDPFERRQRHEYLAFGAYNPLAGVALAWPFSRLRPGFGLSLGAEIFGNSFADGRTRYRQQVAQATLSLLL